MLARIPYDILIEEFDHLTSMGYSPELALKRLDTSLKTLKRAINQRRAA